MLRLAGIVLALSPLALAQAPKKDFVDKVLNAVGPYEFGPLSEKERFRLYILNTAGPIPLLGEAAGAGISHWENSPKEWGQGWNAYGKRYGSNLAYNAVRQTITYGTSVVLREDNRYFASHKQGVWKRAGYAALSTFTARRPSGATTVSISGISGVLGAGAISSIWGPPSWKGPKNIGVNVSISFATTAAVNVVREFLPDIL